MERPEIRDVGSREYRYGFYEPGNMTRYTAVAIHMPGEVGLGILGVVTDGWLVVSGNTGKAYLFQGGKAPLLDDYVQQHLGGLDGDYPYMGDLVRKLTDRPGWK